MSKENEAAHKEIETFLRSGSGQSLAQVAVILGVHRAVIQGYSSDLQGFASQYTMQFTNHFKEGPGGGPKLQQAGDGTKSDQSSDGGPPPAGEPSGRVASRKWRRRTAQRPVVRGQGSQPTLPGGPLSAPSSEGAPRPSHNPLTSLMGGGLPSLPSMPGGGSAAGFRWPRCRG